MSGRVYEDEMFGNPFKGWMMRLKFDTPGFYSNNGIYIGSMAKGALPLWFKFHLITPFNTGGVSCSIGFDPLPGAAYGGTEWTGFQYLNGAAGVIDITWWRTNITVLPLAADRPLWFRAYKDAPLATPPGGVETGEVEIQIAYGS
jgi:hypothetical protein